MEILIFSPHFHLCCSVLELVSSVELPDSLLRTLTFCNRHSPVDERVQDTRRCPFALRSFSDDPRFITESQNVRGWKKPLWVI